MEPFGKGDGPQVVVRPATESQRLLLEGLFQFYAYDWSEMEPPDSAGFEVDAAGRFRTLSTSGRILVGPRPLAFAHPDERADGRIRIDQHAVASGRPGRAEHGRVLRRAEAPAPACSNRRRAADPPLASGPLGDRRGRAEQGRPSLLGKGACRGSERLRSPHRARRRRALAGSDLVLSCHPAG